MEREQQITKLINVLRRTALSVEGEASKEVVDQAIGQYNRVLSALTELDEGVGPVFVPLEEGTGPEAVAAACRQLASYYRDEVGLAEPLFDTDAFREFWQKSAQDLEEVGDFIRESIEKMKEKKRKHEAHSNGAEDSES